jgi:hypothetical protein
MTRSPPQRSSTEIQASGSVNLACQDRDKDDDRRYPAHQGHRCLVAFNPISTSPEPLQAVSSSPTLRLGGLGYEEGQIEKQHCPKIRCTTASLDFHWDKPGRSRAAIEDWTVASVLLL